MRPCRAGALAIALLALGLVPVAPVTATAEGERVVHLVVVDVPRSTGGRPSEQPKTPPRQVADDPPSAQDRGRPVDWDAVAAISGALAALTAIVIGVWSVRTQRQLTERTLSAQRDMMHKTLAEQRRQADVNYQQNFNLTGSQAAIAWRDQVISLHDRGLTPEQIRYVFSCETGWEGYEEENGIIDEVLRHVPRSRPSNLEAPQHATDDYLVPRPSGKKQANRRVDER